MSDKPIVEVVPIESLQPDPRNANLGTERGSYMLNDSLTKRGAGRSILATGDNVILAGNKTHEQAVQAGFTEVIKVHTTGQQLVAVVRDDLEHGSQEATRMAIEDNRIGQASLEFDPAVLLEMAQDDGALTDGLWRDDEWEELLGELVDGGGIADPEYSRKIEAPIYEPTGKKPSIDELVDVAKFDKLVQGIESADLDTATRDFLRFAAYRHCVFNYEKVAEFYAQSEKGIQELMEKSALVIIDFDAAIENGFVKLSHEIAEVYRQDHGNG